MKTKKQIINTLRSKPELFNADKRIKKYIDEATEGLNQVIEIGLTDTEFTLIVMNVLLFKFIEGYNNLLDEDHKNISSDQSKITYNLIML